MGEGRPSEVTVSNGEETFVSGPFDLDRWNASTAGLTLSPSYRIGAQHYFETVTADTYLPAGSPLFTFTPANIPDDLEAGMNGFRMFLPGKDSVKTQVDLSKLSPSDFEILDTTVSQSVYVEEVALDEDWDYALSRYVDAPNVVLLKTGSPFREGHKYTVKLSSTSGSDEIRMPPAGNDYVAGIGVGSYFTSGTINVIQGIRSANVRQFPKAGVGQAGLEPAILTEPKVGAGGGGDTTGGGGGSPTGGIPAGSNNDDDLNALKPQAKAEVDSSGRNVARFAVTAAQFAEAADSNQVTVQATSEAGEQGAIVDIPAAALQEALEKHEDLVVSVVFQGAGYELPIGALPIESIAAQLGVEPSELTLSISAVEVVGEALEAVRTTAEGVRLNIVSAPIEFQVAFSAGGNTVLIEDFGNIYVNRTITLEDAAGIAKVAAYVYDPEKDDLAFVPATVSTIDGERVVTLRRPGNSIYVIAQSEATFDDIRGHWSQADVEALAGKRVVQGVDEGRFLPDATLTRAQAASLLVRSLGVLPAAGEAESFADVKAGDWHHAGVETASRIGLVDGFADGTFRPDDSVTREQFATMALRAIRFVEGVDTMEGATSVEFADADDIADWAIEAVAAMSELDIVQGDAASQFRPGGTTTRAEAAAMLKRMLEHLEFID
jgi:hypothetical protein